MPYTDPATSVAGTPLPAAQLNASVRDNIRFLHDAGADLVAATTIAPTTQFHRVTGNTQIDNIIAAAHTRLWLLFTGTPIVRHNGGGTGNLRLKGAINYTIAAGDVLQFVYDAVAGLWYQVAPIGIPIEFSYNEITSDVTVSATTEATANTVVTATSYTYDGSTAAYITFACDGVTGNGTAANLCLFEDGTSLGLLGKTPGGGSNVQGPIFCSRRKTPSAGAHVYSIRAFRDSGTNPVLKAEAGGVGNHAPAYLRVVRAA